MKIVSGGQTGADQGGLAAGVALGVATGGWAPRGYRTEAGPALWLKDLGLVECTSSNYAVRTRLNIRDSEGTVLFGDVSSAGSRQTLQCCVDLKKPHIVNPDALALVNWLQLYTITVLNVAGNRESVNPGIHNRVTGFLMDALR